MTKNWLKTRKSFLKQKVKNHEGYYICELCGIWIDTPEVHHIIERSIRAELIHEPLNLMIVCPPCHRKRHLQA